MPFGATPNVLVEFNTYEALFWLGFGVGLWLVFRGSALVSRRWLYFSVGNILLFGSTDVVELYTGGFLHTAPWLLYWKSVHMFGLLVSVGWYIGNRYQAHRRGE